MKLSFIFLFLLSQVYSAPAIVTLWQTVTSNIPAPTSPAVNNQPTVVPTTTAAAVAASPVAETQAAPTTTATTGFWGNLLSSLLGNSGSSSSASSIPAAAAPTTPTTPPSTSSTGSSFASFLKGLFGGSSSSSSSSSAEPVANAPATLEVPAAKAFTASTQAVSVPTTSVVISQPTTSSTLVAPSSSAPSASSSSSSSSSGDIYAAISECDGVDESFASEILDAHNKYRALHQVGDLSWDVDTYNYAKNNADNYDCSGILTHTHGQYGENLAAGYKNGPDTVDAWVDEPILYSASSFIYNHFTQVIWKSLTKVGCAYKDCTKTGWGLYVVCEYDPYGNVIGEGPENAFPEK
ncbi:Secreted protein PRY1 [Candida viswanathii]|uniref:Secreted protein PRY1 n=1 Tax=Candida viswanathii TaxID=5486 RepID=A0A367XRT0_9ASCO|nr:Secreted protein PRY1 [Candida viswanathii]